MRLRQGTFSVQCGVDVSDFRMVIWTLAGIIVLAEGWSPWPQPTGHLVGVGWVTPSLCVCRWCRMAARTL